MKVLLIDVHYKHSSTGKIVQSLYQGLNTSGYSAAVCYGRGVSVSEPNIYKFAIDFETLVHAGLTRLTGLTGVYSPISTRRLIRFIERFQPDVVHIHELHGYFVNLSPVIQYLKAKKIRTVWTFHCEFMYTGKCGHSYDCQRWRNGCGHCPQVREYPASMFLDFTGAMFRQKQRLFEGFESLTIVTPSNWLANRVKQSFLGNRSVKVVYNGIDTSNVFYPRPFQHLRDKHNLNDEKVVLAVAPNLMSEAKGGVWAVELAWRLRESNTRIILIGVDDLRRDLGSNVIALPRTNDQAELAAYYSMADITLLTSMKETFSLVCAESLSCGTPVVGFDSGAPREIVPKGFGVFVPYGDIDSLEKVVRDVLLNRHQLRPRQECTDFGRENFDNTIMVNKYKEIYDT